MFVTYDNDGHDDHENENVDAENEIGILAVDDPFGQGDAELGDARTVRVAVLLPVATRLLVRERLVGFGQLLERLLVATLVRMHRLTQLAILFLDLFIACALFY